MMPIYVYTGDTSSLSLAGRSLDRGEPTRLEGRAAEAAEAHPDVAAYAEPAESAPSGPSYAVLQDRARELGLPATGKKAELAEAVAAEEARLAEAAAAMAAFGSDSTSDAGDGDDTIGEGAA